MQKAGGKKRSLVALICQSNRGLRSGLAVGRKLASLMLAFSSLVGPPLIGLTLIDLMLVSLILILLTLIDLKLIGLSPVSVAAADVQRCSPGAKLPAPDPAG